MLGPLRLGFPGKEVARVSCGKCGSTKATKKKATKTKKKK
jgi:hypothetical protein